jgi:hypothetical protein
MPRLLLFSGKIPFVMPTPDDSLPSKPLSDAQPSIEKPSIEKLPTDLHRAEIGGREGPEPTRFGDWELRGRCIDF